MRRGARGFAALALVGVFAGASAAQAGALQFSAHTLDNHPLKGAIVTVFALDGANKAPPPAEAIVDQVNLAFEPDLTVIPVGSTISFPNSDATSHQVYSFSPAHRFQLPMYRGKP